jgi:nitrogen fixation-related uncharacterized protein
LSILILQIFISLVLVAGAVALFVYTVRTRTLDHADRLALAPLEDDGPNPETAEPPPSPEEDSA